jgi:hypothetical protein
MSKDFTEEQKAVVNQMVADGIKAAMTATEKAAADKKAADDAAKNGGQGGQIAADAKKALEAENKSKADLLQIQGSVKFNMEIKKFFEDNKTLFPEETAKILETIGGKTFADDNEKANTTRKSLLDSFLEKQENIDVLTPSLKTRAETYKALAESDKMRRSGEFWDLAETGLALKLGARKAEALSKINGGNAGESSKNPLEDKILAAANKKFNNKKD